MRERNKRQNICIVGDKFIINRRNDFLSLKNKRIISNYYNQRDFNKTAKMNSIYKI